MECILLIIILGGSSHQVSTERVLKSDDGKKVKHTKTKTKSKSKTEKSSKSDNAPLDTDSRLQEFRKAVPPAMLAYHEKLSKDVQKEAERSSSTGTDSSSLISTESTVNNDIEAILKEITVNQLKYLLCFQFAVQIISFFSLFSQNLGTRYYKTTCASGMGASIYGKL